MVPMRHAVVYTNMGCKLHNLVSDYETIWGYGTRRHRGRPIRLINVQKTIEGEVTFVEADPTKPYCVLSYVWMSENRKPDSKHLFERLSPFTVNGLIKALQVCCELRHEYAWIDALCIDQTDDSKEKEVEIQNMGKHFRNAEQCIIFPMGLDTSSHILHDGKLPTWFGRAWTLQEYLLSKPKTVFIFDESVQCFTNYMWLTPITGRMLNTPAGNLFCTGHDSVIAMLRLLTNVWSGKSPIKAPESSHKDIDRESSFLRETQLSKTDVLQRAMFRECWYEEDKVYCLLGLFDDVTVGVEYNIGIHEAIRRLARAVESDYLACMTMCNWFPGESMPGDISALMSFERKTAAVWFNADPIYAKCNYIDNEGVRIHARTMECSIRVTEEPVNTMFSTISSNSDTDVQTLRCDTGAALYGRSQKLDERVVLVELGKFKRVNSVLTGAVCIQGTWICCLICQQHQNSESVQKVGMCITSDEVFASGEMRSLLVCTHNGTEISNT